MTTTGSKAPYTLIRFKSRSEWLEYRKHVITATEASAILGDSPWMSAIDVYMKLVKGKSKEVKETAAMAKGNAYEPLIRKAFALRFKDTYKVINPPKANWIISSNEHPYLCATPDGLLKKGSKVVGGLECKYHEIRGKADAEKWNTGTLPQNYYEQCLHTICVGEFSVYYLCAWLDYFSFDGKARKFDHSELRIYDMYADEMKEEISYEMSRMTDFWENHVQKKIPPEITIKL